MVILIGLGSGCASNRNTSAFSNPPESASAPTAVPPTKPGPVQTNAGPESKLIVTPQNLLVGTVVTYNTAGRFVVLDFPVAKMPARDQVMFAYRQGLKVGEVKIVGPERDHMTVGDLIAGEAQKGDEVRDK
jgi:hypothetical protein